MYRRLGSVWRASCWSFRDFYRLFCDLSDGSTSRPRLGKTEQKDSVNLLHGLVNRCNGSPVPLNKPIDLTLAVPFFPLAHLSSPYIGYEKDHKQDNIYSSEHTRDIFQQCFVMGQVDNPHFCFPASDLYQLVQGFCLLIRAPLWLKGMGARCL